MQIDHNYDCVGKKEIYFTNLDKFYQNIRQRFHGYVNQKTQQHEILALEYFFTNILMILTTFIKISRWNFRDV